MTLYGRTEMRIQLRFFFLMTIMTVTIMQGQGLSAEEILTLSENGQSDYVIVLPKDPTPVQITAADNLAQYFKQITGADLVRQTETSATKDSHRRQFVIGPSETSAALLGTSVKEKDLPYDAIVVKNVGQSIVLSGHSIRGMIYAVDTFLEDQLGVKWWTSKETFVPRKSNISLKSFSTVYHPKLIYRESFYTDSYNGKFAVHEKCNGSSNNIPKEWGGHHSFLYFVHSFYPLIRPEKYFEKHPEWFSEIDGVRKIGYPNWSRPNKDQAAFMERIGENHIHQAGAQLCLTNEEMRKELVKNALEQLRKNPQASFISISQNDWHGFCTCVKCSKIAEEEGAQSGVLLRFVNKVAEDIEKEFPNIYVETLAYQYTRKPPKITKPRKNVVVRLCSIECDFARSLEKSEFNKSFRDDISGWSQMADRLFVWDYVTDFALYLLPFPNYHVWNSNVNFFVNHKVIGLFEQGDYHTVSGDFVQLRNWVMAKMLWNPALDQGKLMNEFIAGYYAPDLVPIYRQYFDTLTDTAVQSGIHLRIFLPNTRKWMTLETITKVTKLLDQAETIGKKLESTDPVKYKGLLQKIQRERIPLDLVWLQDWVYYKNLCKYKGIPFPGPKDPVKLADDFLARLKLNKIVRYRESNALPIEEFVASLKAPYIARGEEAKLPDLVKDLPERSVIDLQEYDLHCGKPGQWTFIEEDPAASNKRSVRMPSSHYEWAISWSSVEILNMMQPACKADLSKKNNKVNKVTDKIQKESKEKSEPLYHIYMYVRCESGSDAGGAMTTGVYNTITKKSVSHRAIKVKECRGTKYSLFDYGTTELPKGAYYWIAPERNAKDLKNVWIDRVIIVREK